MLLAAAVHGRRQNGKQVGRGMGPLSFVPWRNVVLHTLFTCFDAHVK